MEALSLLRHIVAAMLAAPLTVLACKGAPDDGSDEHTICPEHYPADAPRFEDYPARMYTGPVAAVRWRADREARMYRTMLKETVRGQRPNFAGHFIVGHWGCGMSCVMTKIIDARTGQVFHPAGVETNSEVNLDDSFYASGTLRYRPDSRLFVLIGVPEEDEKRRGISFFEWTGSRMKLLRRVKIPDDN